MKSNQSKLRAEIKLNIITHLNSSSMGTSDLPDMCTQSPRDEGIIHIRQFTSACVTTSYYFYSKTNEFTSKYSTNHAF